MKTVILGLDAFDPTAFERLQSEGKMPHLSKLMESGGYSRFEISNPAQSEVSWTSIATGLNPGGHGMFDFVHRNPESYALHVSLLPTKKSRIGIQFVPPYTARTIFDEAVDQGYPATSLWWPATFPVKMGSGVRTIPGLGTPDIFGRLGVGIHFSIEPDKGENQKTEVAPLTSKAKGLYLGRLPGPATKSKNGSEIDFELEIKDAQNAQLTFQKQRLELKMGQWSQIFELNYKLGFGVSLKAVSRALLLQTNSDPEIYFLPLQIHPLKSPWHYAAPNGFIKDIWNSQGPFLTLGWPQDTSALGEGIISDEQFLELCEGIVGDREKVFMDQLSTFREGVLACVFDTLDRVQHMFWRDRQDVVDTWYQKMDGLVGRVTEKLNQAEYKDVHLLVVSDHGFNKFDHKVHLNRWLLDEGLLSQKETIGESSLKNVDWEGTRAYALGLNSIYLNMQEREGQGTVSPGQREAELIGLKEKLSQWQGPDGGKVVNQTWTQDEAFDGPLKEYGPDLVIGYAPGYRASSQTGLGEWDRNAIEPNQDHWGADHCIDPNTVPGVLFSSASLSDFPKPSYRDFPALAINKQLDPGRPAKPPTLSDEDQKAVEERLKDLGYL